MDDSSSPSFYIPGVKTETTSDSRRCTKRKEPTLSIPHVTSTYLIHVTLKEKEAALIQPLQSKRAETILPYV
ncbi:hypothetical protein J6590_056991 [Homalodisca vitripennis]|nr:hypothetical protein J6590_056991 [Homalodisca vitripennis]